MTRLVHVSIASLVLAACGSDDPDFGPETAPTATQQTAITATEQSLTVLAAADVHGPATASAAFGLATSSLLLIIPESSGRTVQGHGVRLIDPAGLGSRPRAAFDDCAVIGESSIVWTSCMQTGFSIDGMISWAPGHVDFALTIDGMVQGFTFGYDLAGDMTVSDTAIQGNLTLESSAMVGGNSFTQTVSSEIDVALTDGCISSGTLTVKVSGSGTGAQRGAVQIVWTGCKAFRVRNA